jgi:hypothetical protein
VNVFAVFPQEMDTFSLYLNFIKLPIKLCDNLAQKQRCDNISLSLSYASHPNHCNALTEMEDNHIVVKPTRREPLLLE